MKPLIRLLALFFTVLSACGKAPRPVGVEGHPLMEPSPQSVTTADLAHRPINDLVIIVFKSGGDSTRWQRVFADAGDFSRLRARGRALVAQNALIHRDEINANNLDILTVLTRLAQNETAFLMQLSSDAGCAFGAPLDDTHVSLSCDEDTLDGIPRFDGIAEITFTRRNGRDISPAVRLRLRTDEDSSDMGQFALSVDLVPEHNHGLLSYKGTVTVDEGAHFFLDGQSVSHHTYGFSEMSLRAPRPLGE